MRYTRGHVALVSNAWLICGGSLAAIVSLVVLLWNPRPKTEPPRELVLYCAAGLIQPVEAVRQEYEHAYGVKIQVEPDGSGKLLSKLRVAGDRGDLFLAADSSYIELARKEGLVAEAIPVASIHPVIVTRPGNPKQITGASDLLRDNVTVALANPELAAVGQATRKALAPTGEWVELEKQSKRFQAKVSLVGTVNEVAQAVKLGAADAGIVWDATARQFDLPLIEVPALTAMREQITLGVLQRTHSPQQALHFARYLAARDKGLEQFHRYHFTPAPAADRWAEVPEVNLMIGAMLRPGVEPVLKQFEKREGVQITAVYNGCGILVAQMKSGQMPDAYFACDQSFLDQVAEEFLPSVTLTENDMVILVAKGNPRQVHRLDDLLKPELRVGLADPQKSALGWLAHRLLQRQGLAEKLQYSQNLKVESATGDYLVNQILTDALDAVIVYRSNAQNNPDVLGKRLDLIEIEAPRKAAVQPFAIAKRSPHQQLLRRLLAMVTAADSRQRFEALGFRWDFPPESR